MGRTERKSTCYEAMRTIRNDCEREDRRVYDCEPRRGRERLILQLKAADAERASIGGLNTRLLRAPPL